MDRYVVMGNPVAHSLSPAIHALFARQTGEALEYSTLLIARDAFATQARRFFDEGGRGASVTLPFKVEAFELAHERSARAAHAGAANFLAMVAGRIHADNTDGAGLARDLARNLAFDARGKAVLLVGAGGAARGVLAALVELAPARVVIANRTAGKARELALRLGQAKGLAACSLEEIPREPFDLVLNATSTSTRGEPLLLPAEVFADGTLAYDMAYGKAALAFVEAARARGARATDGLGMLVEQAAESFELWRGVRPDTRPVLDELRMRAA